MGLWGANVYWVNTTRVRGSDLRENLKDMIKYNMTENAFLDELVPANPVGTMDSGTMTSLPTVGEKGTLVVFGGRTDGQVMVSFTIALFKDRTLIPCSPENGGDPHLRYQYKNMVHTGRLC